MTRKIHSFSDPLQLLASVLSLSSLTQDRTNAAEEKEILQVSMMRLPEGKSIVPHRHLPQSRITQGTSEAWIVISGEVQATVFDFDSSPVATIDLVAGDCMVLYRGGHSFTVMSDNTVLYEIKNGPYYGAAADSEKIQ
jgi:cupin fold WbuC family metalloprotein